VFQAGSTILYIECCQGLLIGGKEEHSGFSKLKVIADLDEQFWWSGRERRQTVISSVGGQINFSFHRLTEQTLMSL
jgi:hypothetical protein